MSRRAAKRSEEEFGAEKAQAEEKYPEEKVFKVDEKMSGIFALEQKGTVRDVDGDIHELAAKEKIKVLDPGEYADADWLCTAEKVTVRFHGIAATLKKGTPLAVLEENYAERLKQAR